jgi:cytolysin (calcineurin-like family phosphatase)
MPRARKLATFVLLFGALALVFATYVWSQRAAPAPLRPIASGPSSVVVHPPPRRTQRLGGLDVTFLVASDTHFGYDSSEADLFGRTRDPVSNPKGTDEINARQIDAMNSMPGWRWPTALGGTVGEPRGLLISGDLTENGDPWQWRNFVLYYGLSGRDGLVRYPVFEAHGNHDKHHSWYVLDRIRERHGGTRYAFDWDDLHLVCLGEAPDERDLEWLGKDLASVGGERPVVIYFHFPLLGPFSEDNWFGRGNYRQELARVIAGYNVIALFHGHYHASGRYRWQGIDVYNVGAAKHKRHSFAVVHVSDERLQVASYHHGRERWEWWHRKPINGAAGESVAGGINPDRGELLVQPAP